MKTPEGSWTDLSSDEQISEDSSPHLFFYIKRHHIYLHYIYNNVYIYSCIYLLILARTDYINEACMTSSVLSAKHQFVLKSFFSGGDSFQWKQWRKMLSLLKPTEWEGSLRSGEEHWQEDRRTGGHVFCSVMSGINFTFVCSYETLRRLIIRKRVHIEHSVDQHGFYTFL